MSNKGIYKYIEESSLPKFDTKELENFLAPVRKFDMETFRLGTKLWRILPNGDWVRIR